MCVYVIYDKVADKLSDPFLSDNDKSAVRVAKRGMPVDWSDDFLLYKVSEFQVPEKGDLINLQLISLS